MKKRMTNRHYRHIREILLYGILCAVFMLCLCSCDTPVNKNEDSTSSEEKHSFDVRKAEQNNRQLYDTDNVVPLYHVQNAHIESNVDDYSQLLADAAATDTLNLEQFQALQMKLMTFHLDNQPEKIVTLITQLNDIKDISALNETQKQNLRYLLMTSYRKLRDNDNAKIIAQRIIDDYETNGNSKTAGFERAARRILISIFNKEGNAEYAIKHAKTLYDREYKSPVRMQFKNINATLYVKTLALHGKFREARVILDTFPWESNARRNAARETIEFRERHNK